MYITLLRRNNKKGNCQLLVKVWTLRSCPGTTRRSVVSYWWKFVHYAPAQEQQEGQLSVTGGESMYIMLLHRNNKKGQLSLTGESMYITLLPRDNKTGSCQFLVVKVCTLRSCTGTTRRAVVPYWWKYVHYAPVQEQQEGQLSVTGESMYFTLLSRSNKKGSCQLLVKVYTLRSCPGATRRGSCHLLVKVYTLRSCPGTTRRAVVSFWWWKYVHYAPAHEQQEGQLSLTGESMYITLLSRNNKMSSCQLLVKVCTLRSCPGATRSRCQLLVNVYTLRPCSGTTRRQLSVTGESMYITLLSRNNKKGSCQLLVKVCTLRSCPGTTRRAVVSYWWKYVHYAQAQEQLQGQLSVTGEGIYIMLLSKSNKKGSCQFWWKFVHYAPAQEQEGQLSVTGESVYVTLLPRNNKKGSC